MRWLLLRYFSEESDSPMSFWMHFILSSNKAGILFVAYTLKILKNIKFRLSSTTNRIVSR